MKHLIIALFLVTVPFLSAVEESADDIAKRVIVDKSSAHIHIDTGPLSLVPPRNPEDDQLAAAAGKSYDVFTGYLLSDVVPEKVRVAYAIRILATKRVPKSTYQILMIDAEKNDAFLKDGLILAKRLAEIEKAEQGGADQPATAPQLKSEGKKNTNPQSEGRSR